MSVATYVRYRTGETDDIEFTPIPVEPSTSSLATPHEHMTPDALNFLRKAWAKGEITVCPVCKYPLPKVPHD